jgi:uncharacterized protein (TIGR03083 family)
VEILAMIADERRRTADLIDTLSPEQLRTPSLCAEWTVHDVAAHLYAAVATPLRSFLWAVLRSGMNPHRANLRIVADVAARCSATDLAAGLRENAEKPFKPPFVGYLGPLTDLLVHGQDMRRPLGISHDLRPEPLRTALDFVVGGKAIGFAPKDIGTGIRYEATDLDWSSGSGPLVQGTGEALLMALTGRLVALDDLTGDGRAELRRRWAR